MVHFCTYFDRHYIHRGLALYDSLTRTAASFTLWVLCFDDETERILRALDLQHLRPITASQLETHDAALAGAKSNRTRIEYYWTSTPSLVLYLFSCYGHIESLVYVDADVCFFSSPSRLFDVLNQGSVLIVPHDFAAEFRDHVTAGKYNVGVMVFRRDSRATDCVAWWRERCLEWCYDRHEDGKIGDQGYLNLWPERFGGVVVSNDIGINAAPWNVSKYAVSAGQDRMITIHGRRLVCYHFHGLKFCSKRLAFIMGSHVGLSNLVKQLIYRPYLRALRSWANDLKEAGRDIPLPTTGLPWRYVAGRVLRFEPVRHFMWLS